MKASVFLFLIFSTTSAVGQLIDDLPKDQNGKLLYSEVIQVDSALKETLYLRSKLLFVDLFKSAKDVIQLDEKESGIIVGKGFQNIVITGLASIQIKMWYTIKIQSRDSRYKYEIYDIYFGEYQTAEGSTETFFDRKNYYKKNGEPKDFPQKYRLEMERGISSLISTIKEGMLSAKKSGDDW